MAQTIKGRAIRLSDLQSITELGQDHVVTLDIEGTVWWSSPADGRIILHDGGAAVQLDLDMGCTLPAQGDRITLEGRAAITRTRDVIKVSDVPVVENNGLHGMIEQSGSIHLAEGYHPVRVVWFNRTDRSGLEAEMEGPDMPRRKVPDSMLFRMDESGRYESGLDYRSCEGQWWRHLPNFNHLPAVKEGITANFNIAVQSRPSHVGLEFAGYIRIPRSGTYTFYLTSDDGSRLFIGPPSLRMRTVGAGELPSAIPVALRETLPDEPEFQWSSLEGDIVSVHRPKNSLELEVMTKAGLVRVKVAEDSEDSLTLWPGNMLYATGASRRIRNYDGRWMRGEFYVQHAGDLEQTYISPSIWSEYPVVEIADLLQAGENIRESVVHVRGRIALGPDGQTAVADHTASISLSGLPDRELDNRDADILGRVTFEGTNRILKAALFRSVDMGDIQPDSLPLLTTVEQVYQLSMEESARRYPLRIKGVITSPMVSDAAVLQDASRGIYVALGGPVNLQIGDYCEIEGYTAPYEFSQFIEASRVEVLGSGSLPEPIRPTWEQLISGSLHCNYVEIEGMVAAVEGDSVTLSTRDGRINVRLNANGPEVPGDALGATVRLRGCLFAERDEPSRKVVVGSIYMDQHWVAVVHPAPIDPFAIPRKSMDDLLQFDPKAGALQRVRVSGQLVYRGQDMCCLMDNGNGLRFVPVEAVTAAVGDLVDVVGFLELGGPTPVLREAAVRTTGHADLPPPNRLEVDNLLQDEFDATFVQLEGILLLASRQSERGVLELQSGLRRFIAEVAGPLDFIDDLAAGSRLQLSGVYLGEGGNRVLGRPIDTFKLLLNSTDDIRVLSRPPWWTLKRMMSVVGALVAVLVAALIWIKLLRRTVEERTEQLGDQIRERQRAERQREIEQERARLAHDLHDDLGARLTEVNMLASLVKSPATSADEKKKYAEDLNVIALQMVTSLDEIVWAVNPRNDTVTSLAGYFGAYAQRLLELASITCGLDVAEDLPDQSLDPKFRQDVFLAFKEALTNVIQHSHAKKVWVRIFIQNSDLVVIVSDDGSGMLPEEREVGADGLMNMKERMGTLGGQCTIQSNPGKGTEVRLQAPIKRLME
jgi:signal transduction histidine kinase